MPSDFYVAFSHPYGGPAEDWDKLLCVDAAEMQVRRMLYAFELGREVIADTGDEALRQVIAVQYHALR